MSHKRLEYAVILKVGRLGQRELALGSQRCSEMPKRQNTQATTNSETSQDRYSTSNPQVNVQRMSVYDGSGRHCGSQCVISGK